MGKMLQIIIAGILRNNHNNYNQINAEPLIKLKCKQNEN